MVTWIGLQFRQLELEEIFFFWLQIHLLQNSSSQRFFPFFSYSKIIQIENLVEPPVLDVHLGWAFGSAWSTLTLCQLIWVPPCLRKINKLIIWLLCIIMHDSAWGPIQHVFFFFWTVPIHHVWMHVTCKLMIRPWVLW